jgi:ABC-type Mn2+/Zn2+ transport system permease subunit
MNLIQFFITPFVENGFMLNALLASSLVAVTCAGVGSLMILRGMTFISEAFGHGMLPGIAVSVLFGFAGEIGAAISALIMIVVISTIDSKTKLATDTAIGITFISALALGVAIISYSGSFTGDLISALFGDPLGIGKKEIVIQLYAAIIILATVFALRRGFILLCISPDIAKTSGFNPKIYHFLTLVLIATTVVVSFKTVGTALVVGMLIAPSATALLFATNLTSAIMLSAIFGILGVYIGLLASYYYDLAAGASITLASALIFFVLLTVKKYVKS